MTAPLVLLAVGLFLGTCALMRLLAEGAAGWRVAALLAIIVLQLAVFLLLLRRR